MSTKAKPVQGLVLLAFIAATLVGCGQDGGHGMRPGASAGPDNFTSSVQSIAGSAPDDATPVDIDAIAVVLVDDQPPLTVE